MHVTERLCQVQQALVCCTLPVVGIVMQLRRHSGTCCCGGCRDVLQRVDSQCRGHWAAASNQARRRDKQEITGRYFMTDARHGIPVAALNQIRTGERYSYALTLGMVAAAQQAGLRQLHIDIMCKWGPWLQRVHTKAQQLRSSGQMQSQSAEVQQLSDRLAALNTRGQGLSGARLVHSAAHGSLHAQPCQVWVVSDRRKGHCQPYNSR